MFKKIKSGGNETVLLGKFPVYRRVVENLGNSDYKKRIFLLGLPWALYSHMKKGKKNKWHILGIKISKTKRAAGSAFTGENIAENCLDDYEVRLSGHDHEQVRTVFLSPGRSAGTAGGSKRVLLIGHEFSVSGAPLALRSIARILASGGYEVDIAVRDISLRVPLSLYDGIGADVFFLPDSVECSENAGSILGSYDFVIVNTTVMATYAELCKKLNIPHIWFVHEDLPLIKRYFETLDGCRERFFDDYENIVCVSRYVTDCLYREYKVECRYLNNYVDDVSGSLSRVSTAAAGCGKGRQKVFAVVGSIERRKAQETAIAAFLQISAIPEYKGRWKLLIIGKCGKEALDPDLGVRLESVTKNVPEIVWCGQVTERKWELFSSIDFFMVPSYEESSSLVAIESAMLGKPVIVTTHVGAKYLAEKGAGFVFEPGNTAELRKLVEKCIRMPDDEYRGMSRQIRLNYEKTSSSDIYRKGLDALMNDAAERCRGTPAPAEISVSSTMELRSMGSGGNAICFGSFEYLKLADFSDFGKRPGGKFSEPGVSSGAKDKAGVVIPVYNGVQHLKVLIPSLFRNTDIPHKFVFVDDCSNQETADFLSDAIKGRDDCILIRNEKNLGFVRSVNKGAEKAIGSCGSFVMLNSDTEVPSGWLSRLMRPIFEDEGIASVTPLSNRATVFSFPFIDSSEGNDLFLREFGLEGINEAIRKSGAGKYIDTPTGHGFCMAVSGRVWKKLGGLNSELFGRGYGEENEWSLRAEQYGFRNIILPDLYVAHHESGSFTSEERKKNIAASQQIISVMYPDYNRRIQEFIREYALSGSIASIYLSLALQKGCKPEIFTDPALFTKRLTGGDGIAAIKYQGTAKLAVKLLGRVIFTGNAMNLKKTGIFESSVKDSAA